MQPCPARPQTCSATSRSPSPNPHTRRPSCSFRYWSGGGGRCTETCDWKSDGFCDDGGSGAEYSLCSIGTDCADCSRRPPPPPLAVNLNQPCTRTGFICPGDHHGTTSYCQGWASNSVCYSGSCMTPYNCSPDATSPPPPSTHYPSSIHAHRTPTYVPSNACCSIDSKHSSPHNPRSGDFED